MFLCEQSYLRVVRFQPEYLQAMHSVLQYELGTQFSV
jgi:hypothetical protein